MKKEKVHLVWFKKDLRIFDNEAIFEAAKSNKRILFFYIFENKIVNDPHYGEMHNNFIKQSIKCLSLIHISEPTRRRGISYAVFC